VGGYAHRFGETRELMSAGPVSDALQAIADNGCVVLLASEPTGLSSPASSAHALRVHVYIGDVHATVRRAVAGGAQLLLAPPGQPRAAGSTVSR
jgi:hypothetical protein